MNTYKYLVWLKDRYDKTKSYRIRKARNNHFYLLERKIEKPTDRILYTSEEVQVTKTFITEFIKDKVFNYSFDGTTAYTMTGFNKAQSDFTFKRMRKEKKQ